jgi:predicted nucleic acid-binding protein
MWAVIDTSVYIGIRALYAEALDRSEGVHRPALGGGSVGAMWSTNPEAQRTAKRLHRLAHEVEPTASDCGRSRIIQTVGDAHDWDRNKRRDFQNDALIALTARGHGATLVSANREDFEILGRRLGVAVLVV